MRVELFKNPEVRLYFLRFFVSYLILGILGALCVQYHLIFIFAIIILIGFCLLLLCFFSYVKGMYKKMNNLIYGTEKIIKGDYNVNLMEEAEGEISILSFQINQMANRLKLSYEEIENEKSAVKRWISDISHQLKTPLSVIKMFNEILSDTINNKPGQDLKLINDILSKNSDEIENMEWLIQSILKLSKLETGSITMNMKKTDIKETLNKAICEALKKDKFKEREISIDMDGNKVLMVHDKDWLEEAFKNILNNSLKYTSGVQKIKITLQSGETFIKVDIEDEGKGISKADINHIFERFYRGENNKASDGEAVNGTGIGLALAKLIIEKHNGIIEAFSEKNSGTKISIKFLKNSK